jgi:glucokinase
MSNEVYLGIDLGGTRIRAGRFDADLEMEARTETLTLDEEGVDAVIERMIEQVKAVYPSDGRVAGIGISAPGPIDPVAGVITSPPNLKNWVDVPLRQRIQEAVNVPVYLGNDANLAALAEADHGAGRGYRNLIYLTISTGIGAGVITEGRLLIGTRGLGAECGHLLMFFEGERVSTLEQEASGTAIGRQARVALVNGEASQMLEMVEGDIMQVTAKHVVLAAQAGDAVALRLLERAGRIVGCGIVSLLHTFNPNIVIIGGGVAEGAGDMLFGPMQKAIRQYALSADYWENLKIAPAALGEDVCLIGAAALALHRGE